MSHIYAPHDASSYDNRPLYRSARPSRPSVTSRTSQAPAASQRQMEFIASLRETRDVDATLLDAALVNDLTVPQASAIIDWLKALPRKPATQTVETTSPVHEVTEGMWIIPGPARQYDIVIKVQKAVHGSGHLYAKRLNTSTGTFDYEPGLIRRLATEGQPMTLQAAKEFGHLYGMCCVCGATLTDEKSIAAGIGPVCATKF